MILFLKSITELSLNGDSTMLLSIALKGSAILPSPTSSHMSIIAWVIARNTSCFFAYTVLPDPAVFTSLPKLPSPVIQLLFNAWHYSADL